jgi:small ligand-binding sensory domain FIST
VRGLLAGSGLGLGDDWWVALDAALNQALAPLEGAQPDLLVLFASAEFREHYPLLLQRALEHTHPGHLVGCSASAVIANQREMEDDSGVAALALALPDGAYLATHAVSATDIKQPQALGVPDAPLTGILLLADPFTTDTAALITQLEHDYRGCPIVGGLATGDPRLHETVLFHQDAVRHEGIVAVSLGGSIAVRPVVSQGCEPIGATWTITAAENNVIHAIGGRPAYTVLAETIQSLDRERRERVNSNLLVGLAMNEYRDEFKRGDFLIRNLIGADRTSGALAIAAEVQVGQTIQFQIRDARAADEELRAMLAGAKDTVSAAALLFACNGRGVGLFGEPDHDAATVGELLGPLPLAGFFCNGEIGPVGTRTYLHGFTASLALIAPA